MISQILLAFTGLVAIYLTQQSNENIKKYACLFGMAGQPFWFYVSYSSEQWGIFVLSIVYTFIWALGIRNNWMMK